MAERKTQAASSAKRKAPAKKGQRTKKTTKHAPRVLHPMSTPEGIRERSMMDMLFSLGLEAEAVPVSGDEEAVIEPIVAFELARSLDGDPLLMVRARGELLAMPADGSVRGKRANQAAMDVLTARYALEGAVDRFDEACEEARLAMRDDKVSWLVGTDSPALLAAWDEMCPDGNPTPRSCSLSALEGTLHTGKADVLKGLSRKQELAGIPDRFAPRVALALQTFYDGKASAPFVDKEEWEAKLLVDRGQVVDCPYDEDEAVLIMHGASYQGLGAIRCAAVSKQMEDVVVAKGPHLKLKRVSRAISEVARCMLEMEFRHVALIDAFDEWAAICPRTQATPDGKED